MLRTPSIVLLLLAPAALGASIPSLPPAGGGAADPWLDAAGDTMFGDLHAGAFNITFDGKPLAESSGLRYDGDLVCIQGVVACGSMPDVDCGAGAFLGAVDDGWWWCRAETVTSAGAGLVLTNGSVAVEACGEGQLLRASQADWACSEDDDTPFARTLVVAAGGSPVDNGARLRATIANASAGSYLVVVEPGEFDVGEQPLVVDGGLVVAGGGRVSTRIVGRIEMSEGSSMRDVGIVFDGDDCIVLRLTGGVVRLRDVAVETTGCRGMVVDTGASVEFEGGLVSATASAGDLRAAIVHGSLVAREVTFEATVMDATAQNVAVEVVGELTMTGGRMTTDGGGWTRSLLVDAAGAVFADDVTFEATLVDTLGNVGAVDVRGRLRGGNLDMTTLGGGWCFGIVVEDAADVVVTGMLRVNGSTTLSTATLQGIVVNGTLRAGTADVDVTGSLLTEGVVVQGSVDVGRLDAVASSPDIEGLVRGVRVVGQLVLASGSISVSGAGINTIMDLDVSSVTRARDVEVEITFGSGSVASRGVVSRGELTWTGGSVTIQTGSTLTRGIHVESGIASFRDVDVDVRGNNVTGVRIEPAARMLVDWIRANYSTEGSASPLRGMDVAGTLHATRLALEASADVHVEGVDVSLGGNLTLDASSVVVRSRGPAAGAVGLRANGSLVLTGSAVVYDAPTSPIGIHLGSLAQATLRDATVTGNGTSATSIRSMSPRLAIEDSYIEAKSQDGRALHATAGNVTIDRSHVLGLFRSAQTEGATLRSFFTRYEGGQALVGAGQCAANVDRFGGFLQSGCNL